MRLSVVIPCHNAQAYLPQTLGSLLDQTRPADEVVIIDDGSTDASPAIAARAEEATGGLIRAFSKESGSAATTRTIGADVCTGDLLMFLDADDVLSPRVLEGLMGVLAEHQDGVAVAPWRRLESPASGSWVSRPPSCRRWNADYDALGNWLRGWYHPTSAVMWSRTAYDRLGGWDPLAGVNDDGDLMMRALIEGVPLVRSETGTCYYRRVPSSQGQLTSTRNTRRGLLARLHVIEKSLERLRLQGRLASYVTPLREALLQLRHDARGHDRAVRARIEEALQRLGLPARRAASGGALGVLHAATDVARKAGRAVSPQALHGHRPITEGLATATRLGLDRPPLQTRSLPLPPRPRISVIIPTFNRAATLPRAIESVLHQTEPDLELIVVDDGSSDETGALLSSIRDSRLVHLRQACNRGVAAARNRGLRSARGDYIAFLDSDDEWMPEKLQRQLAHFETTPDHVGLLYTGVRTVPADGGASSQMPRASGQLYRRMLVRNEIHGGGSNAMIRRSVVAAVGFFDEALPAIEDYDYWLRVTRTFRVDFVPETLIVYHAPPTGQRKSEALRDNLRARELFYQRYRHEMRRAGVAHRFLLDSAARHLAGEHPDARGARRLARQASRERPFSRATPYLLLYSVMPAGLLTALRRARTRARGRSWKSRRVNQPLVAPSGRRVEHA